MTKTLIQTVEKRTLKNGATLLFQPISGAPRIALNVFVPGGNTLEPVPGMMDLLDRLLMKGTTTRNQEAIALAIDGLTLEMDTATKRDYSLIQATLLEEDLEASLELMADIFYNATFAEFEKEKEKVAGEVHMELDSPRSRVSDLFVRTLFEGTPYNAVSSVLLDSLPKLGSVEALQQQYRQLYHPGRLIISLAGDMQAEPFSTLFEQYFPAHGSPSAPTADALKSKLDAFHVSKDQQVTFPRDDSNQSHIVKGWLLPSIAHADYAALTVMNTILGGGGLSSRLFTELRDKQGLAYNVRSSLEMFQFKGMFTLYIGTEPANTQKCLVGFIEECQKMIDTPVPQKELDEAIQNVLGRRDIYLETAPQRSGYVGVNYTLGRSLEDIEAIPEHIRAVTSADVQRVAQTYLSQPAVVSIVAPSSAL